LIANSARLRQISSPRRNSLPVIFLHQEGLPVRKYEHTDYGLLNRLNRRGGSLTGHVVVETTNQRTAKDDADRGSRCWNPGAPLPWSPHLITNNEFSEMSEHRGHRHQPQNRTVLHFRGVQVSRCAGDKGVGTKIAKKIAKNKRCYGNTPYDPAQGCC
jgi:hypothetical protein